LFAEFYKRFLDGIPCLVAIVQNLPGIPDKRGLVFFHCFAHPGPLAISGDFRRHENSMLFECSSTELTPDTRLFLKKDAKKFYWRCLTAS
jgi:hypothetical protein